MHLTAILARAGTESPLSGDTLTRGSPLTGHQTDTDVLKLGKVTRGIPKPQRFNPPTPPGEPAHLSRSLGSHVRLFLSVLEVVSSEPSRFLRPRTPLMLAAAGLLHAGVDPPSPGRRLALLRAALRLRAEASMATESPMTGGVNTGQNCS